MLSDVLLQVSQLLYFRFSIADFYFYFVVADERDNLLRPDSDKFASIINEVENLHQLGIS